MIVSNSKLRRSIFKYSSSANVFLIGASLILSCFAPNALADNKQIKYYTIKDEIYEKVTHSVNGMQRVIITGDFDGDGEKELFGFEASKPYKDYLWGISSQKKNDKAYMKKGAKLSEDPKWNASFFAKSKEKGRESYFKTLPIINDIKAGCVHPTQILPADLNKDEITDFVIVCHGFDGYPFPGEHSLVMLSLSSHNYETKRLTKKRGFYHDGAIADFNNDGLLDVLLTNTTTNKLEVYINDGQGNFSKNQSYFPQFTKFRAYTTEVLDVNDDGYFDVFVAGHEDVSHMPLKTLILLGNNQNKFSSQQSLKVPPIKGYGVVLDVIRHDDYLYVLRTGSREKFYKGALVQQISVQTMDTKDIIKNDKMRWVDRLFKLKYPFDRTLIGSLTRSSDQLDFRVINGAMKLVKK